MATSEKILLKKSTGEVYCTIWFDEKSSCLIDSWTGSFGTQENFKSGIISWLDQLKAKKAYKCLTDLSAMFGSFDSSREWLISTTLPEAVKSGLKYQAIVQPENIFSKLSTKDYIMVANGLEIRQFGNYTDAIKWIQQV